MSITEYELSLLRDEAEVWYDDVCDIYRITSTDDPYGGEGVVSETPIATGVGCALESGAAHEQERALIAKIQGVQLFTVALPAETDIEVGDHIIVTSKSNLHLRVQAVLAPESIEIERHVIGSTQGEHNA